MYDDVYVYVYGYVYESRQTVGSHYIGVFRQKSKNKHPLAKMTETHRNRFRLHPNFFLEFKVSFDFFFFSERNMGGICCPQKKICFFSEILGWRISEKKQISFCGQQMPPIFLSKKKQKKYVFFFKTYLNSFKKVWRHPASVSMRFGQFR